MFSTMSSLSSDSYEDKNPSSSQSSAANSFDRISVSGQEFTIPSSLHTHLQSLPWCTYLPNKSLFHLDADPKSFRWILHYLRYHALPEALLKNSVERQALHSLALVLNLDNLSRYLQENKPPTMKKRATLMVRTNSDKLMRLSANAWTHAKGSSYNKTPCHELVMGSSPAVV